MAKTIIDMQAQEHFERLIEYTKQAQGITERLKEKRPRMGTTLK